MPTTCCRCNGSGRCRNCSCVKAQQGCTNCLPKRKGTCVNSNVVNGAHQLEVAIPSSTPHTPQPSSQSPALARPHPPSSALAPLSVPLSSSTQATAPASQQTNSTILPPILPPTPPPIFPPACPIAQPQFTWGGVDSRTFIQSVTAAYNEVVHWRRNIFAVPSGKAGKTFVREMAKLYRAYAEGSALETVALKATTILPILLLQKPHHSSKSREHLACLERHLTAWNAGDIDPLLQEGRTIQN